MKIKLDIQQLGDDGYHPFCEVRVNGRKCRALIDTGASKTVIGTQLLKKLKLKSFQNPSDNRMTGIQPGDLDVAFAVVDELKFGKLKFAHLVAGLIDLSHVNRQYRSLKVKPFDLILGGDILVKGNALISYKEKVMKLSKK